MLKIFRFGPARSHDILADVLSVLDETAEEGIVTENFFSPNVAVPNLFVDPHWAMLGVKLMF